MQHLYSIMQLDTAHLEEICQDVKRQYEDGIATCVLFNVKLVPEGNPLINKAGLVGEDYKLFRDRLAEMGLECGILVQCTIGHGYKLNENNCLTQYVNVSDGKKEFVTCPYDVDFQEYIRSQMRILASYSPKIIMVDDDFRLMYRAGKACACPLHLRAYNQRANTDMEREELYALLQEEGNTPAKKLFVETQKEALLQSARAMRAGIDDVDATLPGSFCCVGPTTEFAADIAKILAGKGNPSIVRINNGNYTPAGARFFSDVAWRAADEIYRLKQEGVDYVLAETDTCPQNRYSTGATSLHAHFVGSILEGANGAKHWITRLITYEPNSGVAYRKTLSNYAKFYDTLSKIVPSLDWQGCRLPLTSEINWNFKQNGWEWKKNEWLRCVLERFGFPVYCSVKRGGAVFLEGDLEQGFSDEEIIAFLKGTLVLDSVALQRLNQRGFLKYTGVSVRDWTGPRISYEKFSNGAVCKAQVGSKELVPMVENVCVDSVNCHLENGKTERELFPAVTFFENELGGRVISVCGTPNTPFDYVHAFSFLNESRKKQFAEILTQSGDMPVYYSGDAEVYMKAAKTEDGKTFCALFNIGLDILEEIPLKTQKTVKSVQVLQKDGSFVACAFEKMKDGITVQIPMFTLLPVILLLDD